MEIVSLVGIFVAIAVFIFLASRGINIVLTGIIASLICIFTSGGEYLSLITDSWSTGFSNFMKSYFIIFMLSATFGKILSDSGAAKQIAIYISKITSISKRTEKLSGVMVPPILYFILVYVGVSAWVVAFTVIPISIHVFKRLNIPWRMYMYCAGGSLLTAFAPGSLVMANVAAANVSGVSITAGALMGIIGIIVAVIVLMIFISVDLKHAEKAGEGFIQTGLAYETEHEHENEDENLPPIGLSIIPLVAVIITSAFLKLNVIISLTVGLILCIVIFFKRFNNLQSSITVGLTSCFGPVVALSGTTAFGVILRTVPGFAVITSSLNAIPSIYGGVILGAVAAFLTTAPASAIAAFGADIVAKFADAGLTAETSARLLTMSTFTGTPPHSSGLANTLLLTKVDYKYGVASYTKVIISAGVGCLVGLILVVAGVFI